MTRDDWWTLALFLIIGLAIIAFVLCPLSAMAEQIVPVTVRNLGFSGFLFDQMVPVPPGATAIVGWSGFVTTFPNSGPAECRPNCTTYLAIGYWHDGGTPHELEVVYLKPEFATITPRMLPAGDGHRTVPGDLVWADFYCGGDPTAVCGMSATFYFRVP